MSLWTRLGAAWSALTTPAMSAPSAPFREAAGRTLEQEDEGWRRLTGRSNRDLPELTQRRMQELAVWLWRSNPVANRLIELPVAYLLAEGARLTVEDEEAQGWLDAFWNDPINLLDIKLPKKVRELALYGEQCYPAFVNDVNGHVRLGYLDPALIETVVTDPDNAEQPIGIVTVKDKKGNARRFRVIVNGPETVFTTRSQGIRASFTDGECFYFKVNDLSNSARGASDLLAQIDWLDNYDRFLWGESDRAVALRSFIWDVTLKGATREEVETRAGQIVTPKPNSVRVHNDAEEWNAVSPSLQAGDGDTQARLFRNHIMGGGTIPEHWYGGGGDVNRATAGEMGEPTFKIFSFRQTFLRYMIEAIGTYQIRQRLIASGAGDLDPANPIPEYLPSAQFPELVRTDLTKFTTALREAVVATVQAVERGMLSEETGVAVVAVVAGRLGVEIDPAAELEKAKAEALGRAADDLIPDLPEETEQPERE